MVLTKTTSLRRLLLANGVFMAVKGLAVADLGDGPIFVISHPPIG